MTQLNNQKISVIIPFYQRFEKLDRAIRSVLQQTLPPSEIILVDDGSYSNRFFDISLYQDDRIQIHRHDHNQGPGAARNTGLSHATGAFISFLDSDDYWAADFLKSCMNGLRKSPEAVFAYSYAWEVKNDVVVGLRRRNDHPYSTILPTILDGGRPWGTCCCLWRRAVVEKTSPWPALRAWEDYNFEARASTISNRVICIEKPLCYIEKTRGPKKVPVLSQAHSLLHKSQAFEGIIEAVQTSALRDDPDITLQLRIHTFSFLLLLIKEKERKAASRILNTAKRNDLLSFFEILYCYLSIALLSPRLLTTYRFAVKWRNGKSRLELRRFNNRKRTAGIKAPSNDEISNNLLSEKNVKY